MFLNRAINQLPSALTGSFDFKLPILDESVTFNMGEADVTRIKLIDQTNWTSYAKKGDPDISFQIPSFSDEIASLLGNKKGGIVYQYDSWREVPRLLRHTEKGGMLASFRV